VKFLVDNQLPGLLTNFIRTTGHQCDHVLEHGMEEQSDAEIWEFAKQHDTIVISKDEDFVHLANRINDTGRLLWVRIGNCRKAHLLQRFHDSFANAIQSFEEGMRIVEIR
jgi:predicted nuclease of predicted toxin-antitoxin system